MIHDLFIFIIDYYWSINYSIYMYFMLLLVLDWEHIGFIVHLHLVQCWPICNHFHFEASPIHFAIVSFHLG